MLKRRVFPCLILSPLLLLAGLPGHSQTLFPETGRAAIHQRALDVLHPAVVMTVALEPGMEDPGFLTYARLGRGARVITVYLTDGASTPADDAGTYPSVTAGRRKEEAYALMQRLEGEAYFLNLP